MAGNFNPPYCVEPSLGDNLVTYFLPSTLDGYDNYPQAPGTPALGSDNGEWLYCKAVTAMNYGDCLHIDQQSNASQMTNAFATSGVGSVGFCQVPGGVPVGGGFYALMVGNNAYVNTASGTAAGVPLYTTATPGVLSSTAASQVQVYGLKTTAANGTGATSATSAILSSPRTTQ